MTPRALLASLARYASEEHRRAARMTRRYVDDFGTFPAFGFKHGATLKIFKDPTARMELHEPIWIGAYPWRVAGGPALIDLEARSTLIVEGQLNLKDEARIKLLEGARVRIGGRQAAQGSNANFNSRATIVAAKEIRIGANTGLAWDTLVVDSNFHQIDGKLKIEPTIIGDHVWVNPKVMILAGARIGNDCVIAGGSVVVGGDYPECALIAGSPAKVVRIMKEPWKT